MRNATTSSTVPMGARRSGFALPVAVFALVIIGLLVTGGFYVARQEARIGKASEYGTLAVYIAEQGITEAMAGWEPNDAWAMAVWSDTLTFGGTTDGGTWSVDAIRTGDRSFYLVSEGTVTEGGIYGGATRSVGMFVRSIVWQLDPPGALVTRGATRMTGSSEVAGGDSIYALWELYDQCDPDSLDDKPGILHNDTADIDNRGQGNVTGDPAIEEDPSIGDSTFTVFGDMTYEELTEMATIRLEGGPGMTAPAPSYNNDLSCRVTDPWNWGSPDGVPGTDDCQDHFPIIHITGDRATFQGGGLGQGILLVDGALDLRGDFVFHGIIIVQGSFETQGAGNRINGGVFASNALFDSQNITGGSVVQYSSCAAHRAITESSDLMRPRRLQARTWVDLSAAQ